MHQTKRLIADVAVDNRTRLLYFVYKDFTTTQTYHKRTGSVPARSAPGSICLSRLRQVDEWRLGSSLEQRFFCREFSEGVRLNTGQHTVRGTRPSMGYEGQGVTLLSPSGSSS